MPPAGPAVFEAKKPASGKQRRRMLKAAAWRMAKVIHAKPASLLAMKVATLEDLIEQKCPPRKLHQRSGRGEMMRLLAKIARLRR
jgi:hypothetical protein